VVQRANRATAPCRLIKELLQGIALLALTQIIPFASVYLSAKAAQGAAPAIDMRVLGKQLAQHVLETLDAGLCLFVARVLLGLLE
jgi:hypothetical protein